MKKLILIFSVILTGFSMAHAQKTDTIHIGTHDSDAIFTIVQQMPQFKGDLYQYLAKEIKYPLEEMEKGITGTVYISFVVEKDGTLSNIKVIKGVTNGPGLGKEALRVISGMPKWIPGMQNGHPVRVQYNLPINFELR